MLLVIALAGTNVSQAQRVSSSSLSSPLLPEVSQTNAVPEVGYAGPVSFEQQYRRTSQRHRRLMKGESPTAAKSTTSPKSPQNAESTKSPKRQKGTMNGKGCLHTIFDNPNASKSSKSCKSEAPSVVTTVSPIDLSDSQPIDAPSSEPIEMPTVSKTPSDALNIAPTCAGSKSSKSCKSDNSPKTPKSSKMRIRG